MIIDTNIIVRLIIKDNPKQFEESEKFFKSVEGETASAEISILVLDETIFILQNYYGLSRGDYLPKLVNLLSFPKVKIVEIEKRIIIDILNKMQKNKIDFADFYLAAISQNGQVFSFDKDFRKLK